MTYLSALLGRPKSNPLKDRARMPAILLALALMAALCAPVVVAQTPVQHSEAQHSEAQHYLDDIKALTAPAMEGRGDGTKGLTLAAHLIEQRYKSLGLKPAGKDSYFQPFTLVTGARLKADNHFQIEAGAAKSALTLNQDFVPFSFSSSGLASAPVVFAGYGASATEFAYDDYDKLDVKDKIVVLLRYEPSGF